MQYEPVDNPAGCTVPLSAPETKRNLNIVSGIVNESNGGPENRDSSHMNFPPWLPYSLRWPFLLSLMGFIVLLEVALISIHIISILNTGLSDDKGSSTARGLSFVPTLLAVTLVFLITILFNDVKRTEPFARLKLEKGALGRDSLAWVPGTWWSVLWSGLPLNGRETSWALLCSTLLSLLGSFVVSPFSSTLLVSQTVIFSEPTAFATLDLSSYTPLWTDPSSETYFRTLSSLFQNATTSAWINDQYAITPFWPDAAGSAPLGPVLSDVVQTWRGNTTVFSTESDCQELKQVSLHQFNRTFYDHNSSWTTQKFITDSGCEMTRSGPFFSGASRGHEGTSQWVDANYHDSPWTDSFSSTGCSRYDIFFLNCDTEESPGRVDSGLACRTSYLMGEVPVTIVLDGGTSEASIDEDSYRAKQHEIPTSFFNTPLFAKVFGSARDWTRHLPDMYTWNPARVVGADYVKAVLYDNPPYSSANVSFQDQINAMRRIRQRFLGEALRDVFEIVASKPSTDTVGHVVSARRRIMTVPGVAVVLEVSLATIFLLLLAVVSATKHSRRPLGLQEDPAPVMTVAKLIAGDRGILQYLKSQSLATSAQLNIEISGSQFAMKNSHIFRDTLSQTGSDNGQKARTSSATQSRLQQEDNGRVPTEKQTGFHFVFFPVLLTSLIGVFVAISRLYPDATTTGLHQKSFTYTMDFTVGGVTIDNINPASILTTLIAVGIGLWLGVLDSTQRRIQPYLALSERPTPKGASITYESSYMLWAALRGFKRHHWVLTLVCTASFFTEILTISMASLFSRRPVAISATTNATRTLQIRHVPLLDSAPYDPTDRNYQSFTLQDTVLQMATSWIYGGTAQVAFNGSDLAWNSDGWSFVSSHISNLSQNQSARATANFTVQDTRAVRARLECTPYPEFQLQDWLTEWDLTNEENWVRYPNASNPSLESGWQLGSIEYTTEAQVPPLLLGNHTDHNQNTTHDVRSNFFASKRFLSCCENTTATSQVGKASIGYWSWNNVDGAQYPNYGGVWPANFTVKWIRGRAVEGFGRNWASFSLPYANDSPSLIFVEPPSMMALNCMPVIETAVATVTVNHAGRVLSFDITSIPQPDSNAWSHPFIIHRNRDPPARMEGHINITTSYGVQFLGSLLGTADQEMYHEIVANTSSENVEGDQLFNIRNRPAGLNSDYMSYAMLQLVGRDHDALLDPDVMADKASRTFGTLFQSFSRSDLSPQGGGYVFQNSSERLPEDIGAPQLRGGTMDGRKYDSHGGGNIVGREAEAEEDKDGGYQQYGMTGTHSVVAEWPVEILKMSKPAAWISLVILGYLILTAATVAVASRRYAKLLLRNIESFADKAVLVAGSAKLLDVARRQRQRERNGEDETPPPALVTRLGWFWGEDGEERWGIELVDDEGNASLKKEKESEPESMDCGNSSSMGIKVTGGAAERGSLVGRDAQAWDTVSTISSELTEYGTRTRETEQAYSSQSS